MQAQPVTPRAIVLRIAAWQIAAGIIGAIIWMIAAGANQALAALAGGCIGAGLTLVFAFYAFRRRGQPPRAALYALFQGTVVKLALAAIVFGLVAKFVPGYYVAVLSTFIPGLAGYWLALLWSRQDNNTTTVKKQF